MNQQHLSICEYGVDPESKVFLMNGPIDEEMLARTAAGLVAIKAAPGDMITIRLSTFGGCLYSGLGIYDLLRLEQARGVKVRIVVAGFAMSMGTVILQAASKGERLLLQNATLMVHQGVETMPPDTHPEARKRTTKEFDRIGMAAAKILADRMDMTYTAWKKAHAYDTFFDATGAVKAGLADKIIEQEIVRVKVPAGKRVR